MVYFEIKWNIAMEDTKWSVFIDKTNNEHNNFYLKNCNKNKKYAPKLVFITWCILVFPHYF